MAEETVRKVMAVKTRVQFTRPLRLFYKRVDELHIAAADFGKIQSRRNLAGCGVGRRKRDPRQFAVLLKILEERDENFPRLFAKRRAAGRRLLHHSQPLIQRLL